MPGTQLGVHPPRAYETIYVLRPDVAKEAATKVSGRVQEVVEREGGKLTLVETWGRRQLAYPVRKFKRGVYVYVRYVSGSGLVTELERNLRMLDEVGLCGCLADDMGLGKTIQVLGVLSMSRRRKKQRGNHIGHRR